MLHPIANAVGFRVDDCDRDDRTLGSGRLPIRLLGQLAKYKDGIGEVIVNFA